MRKINRTYDTICKHKVRILFLYGYLWVNFQTFVFVTKMLPGVNKIIPAMFDALNWNLSKTKNDSRSRFVRYHLSKGVSDVVCFQQQLCSVIG